EVDGHPLAAVDRTLAREPLRRREAVVNELLRDAVCLLRLERVAQRAGVGGNFPPYRTAEQRADWHAERLALQVPQRGVYRADGEHRLALAAVDGRAVHEVPDALDRHWVLACDDVSKLAVDDE